MHRIYTPYSRLEGYAGSIPVRRTKFSIPFKNLKDIEEVDLKTAGL